MEQHRVSERMTLGARRDTERLSALTEQSSWPLGHRVPALPFLGQGSGRRGEGRQCTEAQNLGREESPRRPALTEPLP